jgi:hypothetical protein
VKEQLKKSIDSAKDHSHIFRLSLIHNSYRVRDGEPIVWHEKILDEYWNQIEEEWMKQKIVTKIESIEILNVEITKERLAALVAMFLSGRATNSSTQQYFAFNNANLCAEGIVWMSKLVDVSSVLSFLLYHNRIDNMESARRLSGSLRNHDHIIQLHLIHCDLGSSPEILLVMLQSDVLYMDLSNNNIDSLGAVKIAEHLESDPPIEILSLHHNRLNDDDALLISQALKRNTNLTHLNLLGNKLTSTGVKALLTCVFDSSSLNAISESNHTLSKIDFFDDDDNSRPIKELHNCINKLLGFDRTEKLLLALQEKDSLLQYLTNVPVGVIPDVLAFPHGRVVDEHQHNHLNIIYSIMRWWDMPILLVSSFCQV